jgi:hypothetical protein
MQLLSTFCGHELASSASDSATSKGTDDSCSSSSSSSSASSSEHETADSQVTSASTIDFIADSPIAIDADESSASESLASDTFNDDCAQVVSWRPVITASSSTNTKSRNTITTTTNTNRHKNKKRHDVAHELAGNMDGRFWAISSASARFQRRVRRLNVCPCHNTHTHTHTNRWMLDADDVARRMWHGSLPAPIRSILRISFIGSTN